MFVSLFGETCSENEIKYCKFPTPSDLKIVKVIFIVFQVIHKEH